MEDAKKDLADAKAELATGKAEIEEQKEALEEQKDELEDGKEEALEEIEKGIEELLNGKDLVTEQLTEAKDNLEEAEGVEVDSYIEEIINLGMPDASDPSKAYNLAIYSYYSMQSLKIMGEALDWNFDDDLKAMLSNAGIDVRVFNREYN